MEDNFRNKNISEIPNLDYKNYLSISTKNPLKSSTSPKRTLINISQNNRNRSLFNGIFTVAESLKENYIVKTLQPDLGSLTTFINLKEKPDLENYRKSLKSMKFKKKKIIELKKGDFLRKMKKNEENPEEIFLNKKNLNSKILDPIEVFIKIFKFSKFFVKL